jgi:hypothetical protein
MPDVQVTDQLGEPGESKKDRSDSTLASCIEEESAHEMRFPQVLA